MQFTSLRYHFAKAHDYDLADPLPVARTENYEEATVDENFDVAAICQIVQDFLIILSDSNIKPFCSLCSLKFGTKFRINHFELKYN